MKKNTYIGSTFIILVFGIIFVPKIVDRFQKGTVIDINRSSTSVKSEGDTSSEMATLSKVPSFKFLNQQRDTITNLSYKGKVYVVEFFFSTCPSICPVMNTNMLKIQEEYENNEHFGIASFTIDPLNDTPEVLMEYAEKYGANHMQWNFLTGDKSDILKLSNEGFKLYAAENEEVEGGFEHSGLFALIDQEGFVRSRIDGFGNPIIYYNGLEDEGVKMLIEDIKKLL